MSLDAAGKTTDVLIHVVGYTTNTGLQQLVTDVAAKVNTADVLFASITSSGAVYKATSSGLVSAAKTAIGSYTLTFNRPVNQCAVATADIVFTDSRDVSADPTYGLTNQVIVRVTNSAGVAVDTYFSVIVQCLPSAIGAPLVDVSDPSEANP